MRILLLIIFLITSPYIILSQNNSPQINGSFETNLQTYQDDDAIGANAPDEAVLNNAFLNILYHQGKFT